MIRSKLVEQLLKDHDRDLWHNERAELLDGFARERLAWSEERRELLTRIQAPEQAPALTFEPTNLNGSVAWDDDEDFRKAQLENEPDAN